MSAVNQSSYFLDRAYEQKALGLIKKIKSTEEEELFQPLAPVQDFFSSARKIQSIEIKETLFMTAFLDFSSQPNVQWIALKIAQEDVQPKDTYLYNLIEACKKTNSKEIAFKAVEALNVYEGKKKNVIQNLTKHFKS